MVNLINRSRGWLIAATVLVCLLSATAALAVPITYTFSGTGYGTWAGASFGDASSYVPFSFSLSGDTSIAESGWIGILSNVNLTGNINIGGRTGMFTDLQSVFVNQVGQSIGFAETPTSNTYLHLSKTGVGLNTYDLKTSFGPISDPTSSYLNINSVATSGGELTFSGVDQASLIFSATAVPAPAALLLLGSGLLRLLGYGWRKGRGRASISELKWRPRQVRP